MRTLSFDISNETYAFIKNMAGKNNVATLIRKALKFYKVMNDEQAKRRIICSRDKKNKNERVFIGF